MSHTSYRNLSITFIDHTDLVARADEPSQHVAPQQHPHARCQNGLCAGKRQYSSTKYPFKARGSMSIIQQSVSLRRVFSSHQQNQIKNLIVPLPLGFFDF